MKVGDLVVLDTLDSCDVPNGTVGVIVEWDEAEETLPASGWVRWHGNFDWSIVYSDQVRVISESR